jgi:hypothetical protein
VSTLIAKFSTPEGHLLIDDERDIQGTAGTLYAGTPNTINPDHQLKTDLFCPAAEDTVSPLLSPVFLS